MFNTRHTRSIRRSGTVMDAGKQCARQAPNETPRQQTRSASGNMIIDKKTKMNCHIQRVVYSWGATTRHDPPERGWNRRTAPTEK